MTTVIQFQRRNETVVNGQSDISYSNIYGYFFCNWKNKRSFESSQSGTQVLEDVAELVTWFLPDVNVRDRVLLNGIVPYEIVHLENIEMRNIYMILKVKRFVNA